MPSAGEPRRRGRMLPFLALEAATLVAGLANAAIAVVLPWLVLERTGSGAAAGAVAAATALPLIFSAVFSGALVDLVGRRPAAVGSELLSAASVLGIALADQLSALGLWLLIALSVLGAAFDQAGVVARESLLPAVARHTGMRIEEVNGYHEAVWGLSLIGGPALAGLLIASGGPGFALWPLGAAFVVAAGCCLLLKVSESAEIAPESLRDKGLWRSTREGIAFAWNDRLLRVVGVLTVVLAAVYGPVETVVLPIYFQSQQAPGQLGTVLLVIAAATVAGSVGYARVGHRFGRRRTFIAACVVSAVLFFGLVPLPPFPLMLVLGVAIGLAYGPIQPIINIAMQLRPPERLRGRVIGALTSVMYAAAPVGYLGAGGLVSWLGARPTLVVLAVLTLICVLLAVRAPAMHELDRLRMPDPAVQPSPEVKQAT